MDDKNLIDDNDEKLVMEDEEEKVEEQNKGENKKNEDADDFPDIVPKEEVEFHIKVNKSHYLQKEKVIGFIKLYLLNEHQVSDIKIQLVQRQTYKSEDKTQKKIYKPLEMLIPIKEFFQFEKEPKTLSKGEYMFPFNFDVPATALPFFQYQDQSVTAMIKTEIVVSFSHEETYKGVCGIKIKVEKEPTEQWAKAQKETAVKKWGLFSCGKTQLELEANQPFYKTGDIAELKFNIDNSEGKTTINKMKIAFFKKITFYSENKEVYLIREIKLNKSVSDIKCLPENKESGLTYIPIEDSRLYYKPGTNPPKNPTLQPSIETDLFVCEYYLRATARAEEMVLSGSRPRCFLPIQVIN